MQMKFSCNSPAHKAFMELVCCGVIGRIPDEQIFSGLSGDDWEQIYTLARRQTVCGICYDAYCKLPDRLLPDGSLLPRWVARVNAIETSNRRMSEAVDGLMKSLRALGLHPVVQKGLSVARFYINPELRESGDIDLWFPRSEIEKAIAFARKADSNPKSHPDGSLSFVYHGFIVEIHRRLINVSAPRAASRLEAFVMRQCGCDVVSDGKIPSPAPLLELLLINVHIMRHAFGTGIGLRQICDYMRAAYVLKESYDSTEFEKACVWLGISRWTALLNEFIVTYLQASPHMLPPSGLKKVHSVPVGSLMDIVMEGGNFGHHSLARGEKSEIVVGSKLHTVAMFLKRSRFALSIAPSEAFWNFVKLVIGQMR